jgi:hypothetical protein
VPKQTGFVPELFLSNIPPPRSQAARFREAAEYWSRLTPEQEGWVAQRMQFHEFGRVRRPSVAATTRDT